MTGGNFTNINGIPGAASTGGWFGDPGSAWCYVGVPSANQAADGTRPILVRSVAPYIGGRFGAIVAAVWVESAGGGGHVQSAGVGIPSGVAAYRGHFDLPGAGYLCRDVGPAGTLNALRIGFYGSGGFYLGRNGMAGNSIVHTNPADGSFANFTLAGDWSYDMVPSAPLAPAVTQVGVSSAKVTWTGSASGGGPAITGYVIQYSRDATFATGVGSLTVGDVREATITALTAGSVWYFRVAALNIVATAAGTSSLFSGTVNVTLIAATGDLDGWVKMGVLPPAIESITVEGLRRALVPELPGSPNALLRENNVTTAPGTLNADTYGGTRTVTGLTIGATYRLEATGAFTGTPDASSPNSYQLGVVGVGWGSSVVLALGYTPYAIPAFEFVATATSHDIAFRMTETATRAATGDMERLALYNLVLAEIPTASPYRLQSIVYESSLANHFDLANNSVGARWWCDAYGVTQFSADLGDSSPIAVFTDVRAEGKKEYVGILTNYDTRNVVNDLTSTNHGVETDPVTGDRTANDITQNVKDLTSIATWGARADDMDMSLYDHGAYFGSVQQRLADILEANSNPEITITRIRWNAQEDPWLASQLEIYSRIDVEFRGMVQPSRILNIKHDVSPTRWMITLELARKE